MHDGMPYGLIQDQGHVHVALRSSSIYRFSSAAIFHGSWQMTADSLTRGQYLNLVGLGFCIFLVFVPCGFELGRKLRCDL